MLTLEIAVGVAAGVAVFCALVFVGSWLCENVDFKNW